MAGSCSVSDSAGMDTGVWAGRLRGMHGHSHLNGTPSHKHTMTAPGGSEAGLASRVMLPDLMSKCQRAPLRCRGTDLADNHRPGHTPVSVPAPETPMELPPREAP